MTKGYDMTIDINMKEFTEAIRRLNDDFAELSKKYRSHLGAELIGVEVEPEHFYYVCPYCSTGSWEMRISENRHNPTEEELASKFGSIAHEILLCNCGEPLLWFDLVEKKEKLEVKRLDHTPVWPYQAGDTLSSSLVVEEVTL